MTRPKRSAAERLADTLNQGRSRTIIARKTERELAAIERALRAQTSKSSIRFTSLEITIEGGTPELREEVSELIGLLLGPVAKDGGRS